MKLTKNKICLAGMMFLSLLTGCGGGNENSSTNGTTQLLASVTSSAPDYGPIVQQLYIAYFGRPADLGGLDSFKKQLVALGGPTDIQQLDQAYRSNPGIKALVDSFGVSAESAALYSGDNVAFVTRIYNNIFNRAPDDAGLAFWVGALNSGALTKANASLSMMAGGLANMSVQGRLDATLISKKVSVGGNFTDVLAHAPVNGYAGNVAAGKARAMLSNLTASTDVQAFQSTITTFVSDLAIAMNPPVPVIPPAYAAPIANAGMDQNVIAGTVVSLDGSKSADVYGNRITYAWMIKSKPFGSTALLNFPTSVNPKFTADMVGSYEFELVVSNEKMSSQVGDAITIVARAANIIPVSDTGLYKCSTISKQQAVNLYAQGHTYLDRDHDGKPCEVNDISNEIAPQSTYTPPTTGRCYVSGYYRKSGTYVNGYYRSC